jgi:hypothetical protein
LALAVLGLICIGLLGLGFFFAFVRQPGLPDEVVQATPVLLNPTFTLTPTFTPIPPTPTNTSEPTPTGTLVVGPTAQEAAIPDTQPPTETPTTDPNVTPTETPTVDPNITATNTLVLRTPPAGTPVPAAPAVQAPPAQIPQGGGVLAGGHSFLIWAGVGVLLLLIIGLINYLRSPSSMFRD